MITRDKIPNYDRIIFYRATEVSDVLSLELDERHPLTHKGLC